MLFLAHSYDVGLICSLLQAKLASGPGSLEQFLVAALFLRMLISQQFLDTNGFSISKKDIDFLSINEWIIWIQILSMKVKSVKHAV